MIRVREDFYRQQVFLGRKPTPLHFPNARHGTLTGQRFITNEKENTDVRGIISAIRVSFRESACADVYTYTVSSYADKFEKVDILKCQRQGLTGGYFECAVRSYVKRERRESSKREKRERERGEGAGEGGEGERESPNTPPVNNPLNKLSSTRPHEPPTRPPHNSTQAPRTAEAYITHTGSARACIRSWVPCTHIRYGTC